MPGTLKDPVVVVATEFANKGLLIPVLWSLSILKTVLPTPKVAPGPPVYS